MNKTFKELGFKAGDTVVCLASTLSGGGYKKGDEFTLMEHFNGEILTESHMKWNGYKGDWKLKEKDMQKFKVGDKVKVIKRTGYFGNHNLEMGGIYEVCGYYLSNGYRLKATGSSKNTPANCVEQEEIEMYSEDMFEDQWHLNDGKVEIPGDADKLEKDGSVVAFRKRKVKPFEFGEKLRIKKSLWSGLPKVQKVNPGFDYVNAVYLSKYFDQEGVEGIKVYVDNGTDGWECCFTTLDKVERLT